MDGRPFETIEEMDEILIRRWNERVADEDDVYIVGDFVYRSERSADWYLKRLKGRKHLIVGNHDLTTLRNAKAMELFASVEKMNMVVDNGRRVSLCHFPVAEWNGKRHGGFHVHGHIHCRRDDVYRFMCGFDRALNAGCMINDYRPATLDELIGNNLRFQNEAGPSDGGAPYETEDQDE